jgi:hypothetical protein
MAGIPELFCGGSREKKLWIKGSRAIILYCRGWLYHAVKAGRIPCCRVSVIDCAWVGLDNDIWLDKVDSFWLGLD